MNENVTSHPLYLPLMDAIQQAMYGKGERHGGATVPFLEQPIFHYAKMHGRGFLTGQAAKKLEEAAHQREGQKFVDEVLGAIVYAAAAIIRERQKMEKEKADAAKIPGLVGLTPSQAPDFYQAGKRDLYQAPPNSTYRTGLCTCGAGEDSGAFHHITCGSLSIDQRRSKSR